MQLETLRMISSQLPEENIIKRISDLISENDKIDFLVTESKKRKVTIEIYRSSGRAYLDKKEERKLLIIQEYILNQLFLKN